MATIVPEHILFLLSISDENRGVTSHRAFTSIGPQWGRVSSYRHTPKYRRPEKCGSIIVDAPARAIEGPGGTLSFRTLAIHKCFFLTAKVLGISIAHSVFNKDERR